MSLQDLVSDPTRRRLVIDDCVKLVDDEVSQKGGLSGMAVKGAYAVVTRIKPGFIAEVVDHLLDDFVARLSPYYDEWAKSGSKGFEPFLASRSAEVANALLGVTDARAQRAQNPTIKKAYEKLRPTAQKHVEAAIPGIARVIQRQAGATNSTAAG